MYSLPSDVSLHSYYIKRERSLTFWAWLKIELGRSDLNKRYLKLFVWSQVFQKLQLLAAQSHSYYKYGVPRFVLFIKITQWGIICIWVISWTWSDLNERYLNFFIWSQVFQKSHILPSSTDDPCMQICPIL